MAGIKVTALPPSGALEKIDITYLVDVSDDAESPEGTSKQATIQNIIDAVDQIKGGDSGAGTERKVSADYGSELILISGQSGSFTGAQYLADYSTNYVDNSLIARKDAPKIRVSNDTPCASGDAPLRIGDIWIDTDRSEFYYAVGNTLCSDYIRLLPTSGGVYNPIQISIPIAAQSITFFQGSYNYAGSVISCKVKVELLMGGAAFHSYTFKINLPLLPSGNFGNTYDIQGSVIPFGNTTLWHKVNHTSIIASSNTGIPCAEIFVETDNSMDGTCEFVIDFSYIMF